MKKIIFGLGLVLSIWACSSNEEPARLDQEGPKITLLQPQQTDWHPGDSVQIEFRIEENDQLHDVYLGVNNLSKLRKEIHFSAHYHNQELVIDTFCIVPPDSYHLEIFIEASDHWGNENSLSRPLFVYP